MKYEFNSKYININRINLEKSIYNNIVKNMRKNNNKYNEIKEERLNNNPIVHHNNNNNYNPNFNLNNDKICDPSWPLCLYDTQEENLVSTIVLKTGDPLNFIDNYFFEVSSVSYGMYEMIMIYIKDNKNILDSSEVNNDNKDKEKNSNKENPDNNKDNQELYTIDLNKEDSDKEHEKNDDDDNDDNGFIKINELNKSNERNNNLNNNINNINNNNYINNNNHNHNEINEVKEHLNAKAIEENKENFDFSTKVCKDLLMERCDHKCINQLNLRNSLIDISFLPSDKSFVLLTGKQLQKTESKGFNYIKYYVNGVSKALVKKDSDYLKLISDVPRRKTINENYLNEISKDNKENHSEIEFGNR